MKTHNTIVAGYNPSTKEKFIRTFNHPEEDAQMRECMDYVTENFEQWRFGAHTGFDFDTIIENLTEEQKNWLKQMEEEVEE